MITGREPVADAGLRPDQTRPVPGVDLAPEVRHVRAQHLGVVGVAGAPDRDEQLAMGQQPAAVARERSQQLELRRSEVDLGPAHRDLVPREVDAQLAGFDHGVLRAGSRPAHVRLQPRDQLPRPERLGDVVVGAA